MSTMLVPDFPASLQGENANQVVARRLGYEMKRRGLTSALVAKTINRREMIDVPMEVSTPWKILHEDRHVTPEEVLAFAQLFGISQEEMIDANFDDGGTSPPPRTPEPERFPAYTREKLARCLFSEFSPRSERWEDNVEYWMDKAEAVEPCFIAALKTQEGKISR